MVRHRIRVALALLIATFLALSNNSAEAQARQTPQTFVVNASGLFHLAEEYLRRGSPEGAKAILELLARDPNPLVRNEARYRQALLLDADGNRTAAAMLLRRILDQKPDAGPVRLRLATILQKMGDEDGALRQLRALRSANLPPNVARFVDRYTASLQASKPFGVQLEVALAPDSNISRSTQSDTLGTIFGDFVIDRRAKAKSGVGAAIRGLAHGRVGLSDDLALIARATTDVNVYRHKDFNDISFGVAVGPEWRLGPVRLNAEAGASMQWFGMKPYQRTLRVAAGAVAPIGAVSQLRFDASARQADNRFNEIQDGRGISGELRFEQALSPSLMVSASLSADRFKARDGAYSTTAWQAGASAYREIGSATVSASVDVGRLKADERLILLPKARSDRLIRVSLGTVFRRMSFAGFAPMTRLIIERNKSTVEFYDYKRVRTEFGIIRAF